MHFLYFKYPESRHAVFLSSWRRLASEPQQDWAQEGFSPAKTLWSRQTAPAHAKDRRHLGVTEFFCQLHQHGNPTGNPRPLREWGKSLFSGKTFQTCIWCRLSRAPARRPCRCTHGTRGAGAGAPPRFSRPRGAQGLSPGPRRRGARPRWGAFQRPGRAAAEPPWPRRTKQSP